MKIVRILRNIVLGLFLSSILLVILYRFVPVYITPLMIIRVAEQVADGKPIRLERGWVPIDEISPKMVRAVIASEDNLFLDHYGFDIEGMKKAVAGNHLYDISAAIGDYANQFGYGVVEDLCGHGVGSHLHEEPEIPNFRQSRFRRGIKLKPGMTLAVEPMINVGTKDVLWMDDEWTVVTEDNSLSAHYENTILITDGKPEILSLTEEEKKAGFLNLF